jgi:hypothetical protein
MAELDRNMSEGERRDIVRALATRTDRGHEIKETTVQPQYDYAAAAQAAMAADPVDIPPEALADLSARTNAPSEAGSLYAEAQRAIFEEGRGREGEYSDVWFDDHQGVVDASVFALDEYRAAVDAARANALAASATSASASGLTPRLPDGPGTGPDTGDNPLDPWWSMLTTGQQDRLASVVQTHTDTVDMFDAQSDAAFQHYLDSGYTWEQARREVYTYLTTEKQLSPNEAMDLLSLYTAKWESVFKGQEITYDPAAGMGPGITGPYLPTPGVGTAPRPLSSSLNVR